MADVVAIIPARSGSKGMRDKNIRPLAGRPLLAFSVAAARSAKNIDRTIVSTDSEEYADIARESGAEVPFLRPAEFAGDKSADYAFIKHAIDWLRDNEDVRPELLVHLRPTTPLREPRHIEAAIEAIRANPQATALRSVHEMSESAYKTFELDDAYLKSVGSGSRNLDAANAPRQGFATTYQANGYVDVIVVPYVLRAGRLHGDSVMAYVTPRVTEVDSEDDFRHLEYQVRTDPSIVDGLFGAVGGPDAR